MGLFVDINDGVGYLQTRKLIASNNATTLTLAEPFDTDPKIGLPGPLLGNASKYRISTIPEDQTDGVVRDPSLLITVDNDEGDVDEIWGGTGDDTIFGGAGGDIIRAGDDDDIVIGDAGRIDRSRDPDPELDQPVVFLPRSEAAPVVRSFPQLLRTIEWAVGDADEIHGDAGNDLVLGGYGGDDIFGGANDDTILGDNGQVEYGFVFDADSKAVGAKPSDIFTTDIAEVTGGADTIDGNAGNDVILGGVNGSADELHGGDDDDIILGDNGRLSFADPDIDPDLDLSTLDRVITEDVNLGAGDEIFGDAGNDILIGATGDDRISGGSDDDIAFGDFAEVKLLKTQVSSNPDKFASVARFIHSIERTLGGTDTMFGNAGDDVLVGGAFGDRIDGDEDRDLIFGDNVALDRFSDVLFEDRTDPRFRLLRQTEIGDGLEDLRIYDAQGEVLVDDAPQLDPDGTPSWRNWEIEILAICSHNANAEQLWQRLHRWWRR